MVDQLYIDRAEFLVKQFKLRFPPPESDSNYADYIVSCLGNNVEEGDPIAVKDWATIIRSLVVVPSDTDAAVVINYICNENGCFDKSIVAHEKLIDNSRDIILKSLKIYDFPIKDDIIFESFKTWFAEEFAYGGIFNDNVFPTNPDWLYPREINDALVTMISVTVKHIAKNQVNLESDVG